MTLGPRFWTKVEITPGGCWEWTAALNSNGPRGYGVFWHRGRLVVAHRVAYEMVYGPIPDGLQIDHLCRNRRCVKPSHLEVVTQRENILRGTAPSAIHARQSHCLRGHPLSGENLYLVPSGGRRCRTCKRDLNRGYEAAKKAA